MYADAAVEGAAARGEGAAGERAGQGQWAVGSRQWAVVSGQGSGLCGGGGAELGAAELAPRRHAQGSYLPLTTYYLLLTTAQGGYYALLELGFQPAMEMAEVVAQQRDAWLEEEARTAALVLGQRKVSSK